MAFIAAIGIALMAALHIDSALGPVTLWVALYASSSLTTPSAGRSMILVYALRPQNVGWSVAYSFAGIAVAIGVFVAFDMVLWPDPAERKLLRSLADTVDRQRQRLVAIGRAYVDPCAGAALPRHAMLSILPAHLPLLERARRELKNPEREAVLLAAVTTTERLHIAIERLLAIARENVPRDIRARLRPEMEAVLQAIA